VDVEFAVPAVESAYCDLFADVVLGRRIGRRGQIDRQGRSPPQPARIWSSVIQLESIMWVPVSLVVS